MRRNKEKRKLVMFTSLPHVGGHSTLTLGLCRMFSAWFSDIEVWVKVMPEHGHSASAQKELEDKGARVILLSDEGGRLKPLTMTRLAFGKLLNPPDLFFVLTMGSMSLPMRMLLWRCRAVYFYIAHDLNRKTRRRLEMVERIFSQLVFICPATYQEFGSSSGKSAWTPQSSEMPGLDAAAVLKIKRERPTRTTQRLSFGLLGRLTREKGAEAVLKYIRDCKSPCDFHIAGTGPFAAEFQALAGSPCESGPRVYFHGSYSPANRGEFLRDFFGSIDWLLVPSLDEWETLSMVTLEALQHGTPVLCSRAGGLRSFGMPELGPAPPSVIRLFDPEELAGEIERTLAEGPYDTDTRFRQCREHYAAHFCDQKVLGRWLELVG